MLMIQFKITLLDSIVTIYFRICYWKFVCHAY